jgi:hypothetical protein
MTVNIQYATPSSVAPDAIIQLVRAMARRQARLDARKLDAAKDNSRLQ